MILSTVAVHWCLTLQHVNTRVTALVFTHQAESVKVLTPN